MSRAWGWLVAVLAVAVLLWTGQRAEREYGAVLVQLDSSKAREAVWQQRADSLERVSVPQVAAAVKWRTRWDTIPGRERWDTLRLTDTVPVPVEVLVTADSAIASCHVALATCEQRVAAERALTDEVRTQLALTQRIVGRPWTSAGLAYDPLSGALGPFVARDVWRFRLGVTGLPATPTAPARLILSAGLRW